MLTKQEITDRLGIHELTLVRWAKHGIIKRHAYNGHAFLYEDPGPNPPIKHCSRWDRLTDRAAVMQAAAKES
jgi:predicted site-specific integrase-resolvase